MGTAEPDLVIAALRDAIRAYPDLTVAQVIVQATKSGHLPSLTDRQLADRLSFIPIR